MPSDKPTPGASVRAKADPTASPKTNPTAGATAATTAAAPVKPLPTEALLSGAALNRSGELVVPLISDPSNAAPLESPPNVHVTAEATVPLLSDVGGRVRELELDNAPRSHPTRLLDILAKHSVHATFFQQGINAGVPLVNWSVTPWIGSPWTRKYSSRKS